MPRAGYKPPNTTAAYIYIPNPLHKAATDHVGHTKRTEAPGYSLQQFILDAMQEKLTRTNQKGGSTVPDKRIHITFFGGDLFDGWSDVAGIDQPASTDNYVAKFEERLKKAFPGAGIAFEYQPRTSGPDQTTFMGFDFEEEDAARNLISHISDTLLDDSETWLVQQA